MSSAPSNFERMMQVIDEVFATRHDPGQIQVTPGQMKKLQKIHPSTLSRMEDKNGPLIWVLLIPTTEAVMQEFLAQRITEKQLLERTKPGDSYTCIYLCSATALPEYRGKGLTKKLCVDAINTISQTHSIHTLFVWPFTKEGEALAQKIAEECGLRLQLLDEDNPRLPSAVEGTS